jgi:hypothetical protein
MVPAGTPLWPYVVYVRRPVSTAVLAGSETERRACVIDAASRSNASAIAW